MPAPPPRSRPRSPTMVGEADPGGRLAGAEGAPSAAPRGRDVPCGRLLSHGGAGRVRPLRRCALTARGATATAGGSTGRRSTSTSAEYAGIIRGLGGDVSPDAKPGRGHLLLPRRGRHAGARDRARPRRRVGQARLAHQHRVISRSAACRLSALMARRTTAFASPIGELAGWAHRRRGAVARHRPRGDWTSAKAYVVERTQFGQRLADLQGLQWIIAGSRGDLSRRDAS